VNKIRCRVWSDYALFSRPEFKVERVSYPVITPSAARGVLHAIFWKPEFEYRIRRIGVQRLGSSTVILRNELKDKQGKTPIFIEEPQYRQQRSSLMLKDVSYIIEASLHLRSHATDPVQKYLEQFERRLEKGQCFSTPYLGTRECAASFAPVQDTDAVQSGLQQKLGMLLFDIAFVPSQTRKDFEFQVHDSKGAKRTSGYAQALYFDAAIDNGWLEVPQHKYDELECLGGQHVS
jgi:CRISPR-associated protein Cas5d